MGRSDCLTFASLDAVAFRYANYDTPFWSRANTKPGRWHRAGEGPTQYWSRSPDGTWAELLRAENLRSEDEVALVRMRIWAAAMRHTVVDYSEFGKAERAGLAPDALVDDDYERCQREGRRLRALGYAGVLAPSAALPGSMNLTLFGARSIAAWGAPTVLASSIAATTVAIGSPRDGLTGRVRYIGQPHEGYEEYVAAVSERNGQ
jgi:hypothetical protein